MPNPTSGQLSAKEIFTAALSLEDPQQRQVYLNEVCGPDATLRQMVEGLLAAQRDQGGSPLDVMEAAFGPEQTVDLAAALERSSELSRLRQVGPYKLLEQIGQGAFGTVYMAEQTAPLRRKVALKVLKPGMDTKEVVARFEAERQALAMMDHPNISRVLDGGTTAEGRPYFVMELVRGIPLTEYCDEARLTTKERLELFLDVCRAVQHAHQKGIIHRDLKPSNVLVTMHDDKAVAKVIDFGIAKALSQQLTDRTLFTGYQQMLGTPLYMSPEQAQMSGIDIDTRSDVYSLGVMLYELLTGTTPFSKESLSNASFDELRRIIREQEPPLPSVRVTTIDAKARSTMADRRRIDQRKISQHLRGELDWIIMKALEKDRNRRYESASAFAQDIQRYLGDEPVEACPPKLTYLLKKYLKRHRMVASWALAGFAALAVFGTLMSSSRFREGARIEKVRQNVELALREAGTAIEAGDLALAEKPIAEATALVSQDQWEFSAVAARVDAVSAELKQRRIDQVQYEKLLTNARDAQDRMTYGAHLTGDAAAEETLSPFGVLDRDDWLQDLESSYLSSDQKSRAKETIYETLLCLADHGPRWVQTDESARKSLDYLQRAEQLHTPTKAHHWVRSECHRFLKETEACANALAQYNATPATSALDYYLPGHTAGWRGDREAAMRAYQAALRIQPDHYNSLFFLADRMAAEKHFDEAIAYFTGCIALRPNHVYAILNRAETHEKAGNKSTAELDFRAATEVSAPPGERVYAFKLLLEFYRRTRQHDKHAEALACLQSESERVIAEQTTKAGPNDPETLELLTELGDSLCRAGAFDDGIPLLKQALERHRNVLGPAHQKTRSFLNGFGQTLTAADRAAEGVPLLEEALAVARHLHGQEHEDTLIIQGNLGFAYAQSGRAELGVPMLQKALAKFEQSGDTDNTLAAMRKLGFCFNQAQMWDKSVPLLEDALARHVKALGPEHDATLDVMITLGNAYSGHGQDAQVVPLLEDALEKHTRLLGADAKLTSFVSNQLGAALIKADRPKQAIPILSQSLDQCRRQFGPAHDATMTTMRNLGVAYTLAGQFADGVSVFEQLLETQTRLRGADHPESLAVSGLLLEAYRLAGKTDEGKRLALSRLPIVRAQSDEIQLSSALALAADALLSLGEFAKAEPLARECLQIRANRLPNSWLHFNAQSILGGALLGQGQYNDAEPLLLKAFDGLDQHEEEIPAIGRRHIKATIERLVRLYESTHQTEEVARWKARLPATAEEELIPK